MLFTVAFCLNISAAIENNAALPSRDIVDREPPAPITSANEQHSGDSRAKKPAQSKSEEEIIVTGDPLTDKLRGQLRHAFKAFNKGDFKAAERLFNTLAIHEFILAGKRRLAGERLSRAVRLPLNRTITFSDQEWDGKSRIASAPNATANSIHEVVSVTRLDAAASGLLFLRGVAQERQGKRAEALKSYKKAIRLNKHNVDARVEYTLLLLRENDLTTSGKQIEILQRLFGEKCSGKQCPYAEETFERYSQIKLAYTNIVGDPNHTHREQ